MFSKPSSPLPSISSLELTMWEKSLHGSIFPAPLSIPLLMQSNRTLDACVTKIKGMRNMRSRRPSVKTRASGLSKMAPVPLLLKIRHGRYLTPIGGRGPKLLWLLCAEFSESIRALSPLPALALALPVRLRTTCGGPLYGCGLLTPAYCSTCCGATALPCPGGYLGTGCLIMPGGEGRLPIIVPLGPYSPGGDGRPEVRRFGRKGSPGERLVRRGVGVGYEPFIPVMPAPANWSSRSLVKEPDLVSSAICLRSTLP